jgi:5'(3')-deoxyribonucleotidase
MRKLQIASLMTAQTETTKRICKALLISSNQKEESAIRYYLSDRLNKTIIYPHYDIDDRKNDLEKFERGQYNVLIFDQTTYDKEKVFEYQEWLESIHPGIQEMKLVFIVEELITPKTDVLFFVKKINDPEKMANQLLKYFPAKYID